MREEMTGACDRESCDSLPTICSKTIARTRITRCCGAQQTLMCASVCFRPRRCEADTRSRAGKRGGELRTETQLYPTATHGLAKRRTPTHEAVNEVRLRSANNGRLKWAPNAVRQSQCWRTTRCHLGGGCRTSGNVGNERHAKAWATSAMKTPRQALVTRAARPAQGRDTCRTRHANRRWALGWFAKPRISWEENQRRRHRWALHNINVFDQTRMLLCHPRSESARSRTAPPNVSTDIGSPNRELWAVFSKPAPTMGFFVFVCFGALKLASFRNES